MNSFPFLQTVGNRSFIVFDYKGSYGDSRNGVNIDTIISAGLVLEAEDSLLVINWLTDPRIDAFQELCEKYFYDDFARCYKTYFSPKTTTGKVLAQLLLGATTHETA
ncbi:MAG: hypothetical protein QNJ68_03460 [Microcoleaceae cyanobacterium MO_207.B10]|nr:hypothetical protein [Microcoleaceae cyanobacterium MO_207.B10]